MPKITLFRKSGWYGRIRHLKLFIDGEAIGKIKSGETITLSIPDTAHEIYGKMDWGKTKPLSLSNIQNGQNIEIVTWFTLNPLLNMGFPFIPMRIELSK